MSDEQWDRYWPCLLDRLRDDEAESGGAPTHQSGITLKKYREAVLRDLIWLLNSSARPKAQSKRRGGDGEVPMGAFEIDDEEIDSSVLNYGIRDLCGTTGSRLRPLDFERMISGAVRDFEPRILPNRLDVDVHGPSRTDSFNTFSFELRGQLWARPVEPLNVETEVDLERGECRLKKT